MTAVVRNGRFNPYGSGSLDLLVLNEKNEWEPEPTVRLPNGTTRLFAPQSELIYAMTTGTLMSTERTRVLETLEAPEELDNRLTDTEEDESEDTPSSSKLGGWLSRLTGMQGGAAEGFDLIFPANVALSPPRGLVISSDGRQLIALTQGRLLRLEPDGDNHGRPWNLVARASLPGETTRGSNASGQWKHRYRCSTR